MNVSDSLKQLKINSSIVIVQVVTDMFSEFVKVTPIDTGQLRTSWTIEKHDDGWVLRNNMEYANIIFDGLRIVAGKKYGSNQLPLGLDPIIMKYNIILQEKLKRIQI